MPRINNRTRIVVAPGQILFFFYLIEIVSVLLVAACLRQYASAVCMCLVLLFAAFFVSFCSGVVP